MEEAGQSLPGIRILPSILTAHRIRSTLLRNMGTYLYSRLKFTPTLIAYRAVHPSNFHQDRTHRDTRLLANNRCSVDGKVTLKMLRAQS